MSLDSLTHLVEVYRYWILIPLSIVEGPVVALFAGTLASLGYLNIYILIVFFFVRDMIMDAGYYALGYYGGRTAFVGRMLAKLGITEGHFDEVRLLWEKRAGRTMFVGKISYGIAPAFIVAAGTIRMSLWRFFGWGAVTAVLQYGVLLMVGYFFGVSLGSKLQAITENALYVVGIAGLAISGYYVFSIYMRNRLLKQEKKLTDKDKEEKN